MMLIHGLIHFAGFAKAYGYGNLTGLTKYISKTTGLLWFFVAVLFVVAIVLFLLKKENWPYLAIIAIVISQILIITVWKDAKSGTIANVTILLAAVAAWGSQHFESTFRDDVISHLLKTRNTQAALLTEADMKDLPLPVQKYLRYCNVVNKPKVRNIRVVFDGELREKGKDWFTLRSVQYNFFDQPARLFFLKAKMYGLTVPGYHDYQQAKARMNIKLFGLLPMVQKEGMEMDKAETVTVFNDMCLLAPATLIDKSITWVPVDSLSAKAVFTNGTNKISATLYFNHEGQLVNFISDDRYAVSDMKQYRFSTPVKEYTSLNGINIFKSGEAVWHYPDGEFVYGRFVLKSIEYNVAQFEP